MINLNKNSTKKGCLDIYSLYRFTLIFMIAMLFTQVNVWGQSFCETSSYGVNPGFKSATKSANASGPFYLRVYVHVIRRDDGTGGQPISAVHEAMSILNADFNPHNIYFVWDCVVHYVDSDHRYLVNHNAIFRESEGHDDGIDMYLFPDEANGGGSINGDIGELTEFRIGGREGHSAGISYVRSSVMSHEMGHILNLYHTHHGCEEGGTWENTDGSNCDTAGDYICDTPADPKLIARVDAETCEWNGAGHPATCAPPEPLDNYNPNTRLIMSYTKVACREYFTEGQAQRMRDAIVDNVNHPHLQAVIVPNLAIIDDYAANDVEYFETDGSISLVANIDPGADITYTSRVSINLFPGFHAQNGSKFHAYINGCDNTTDRQIPSDDELGYLRNYPNPFTGQTTIEFVLTKDTPVTLFVSDVAGRTVAVLLNNDEKTQGTHSVTFNGDNYPAGMYYYTIQAGDLYGTQKMILAK